MVPERKIWLLWPTARPNIMKATWEQWQKLSSKKCQINTIIAVNTIDQRKELADFKDVLIVGDKPGVTHACYALTKSITAPLKDIIILVSDDFFPPKNWDIFILQQFKSFEGCLLVKDGYQGGGCVTIPIMTMRCLEKLNRILYHPIYKHEFSDAKLFDNLQALGMIKNLRKDESSPIFEHRHWANGKRDFDHVDKAAAGGNDGALYEKRRKMSLKDRLKV